MDEMTITAFYQGMKAHKKLLKRLRKALES